MENKTLLVIGATGKTGRRISQQLIELGHEVRNASRKSQLPFDWQKPEGWDAVLAGVQCAYVSYYPDLAIPGAPDAIRRLTECARQAGVQRLVLLSGRGEVNAQRCEAIVRECGLEYTLIRASWFAQNFGEGYLLQSVRTGAIAMPAGDVLEPFVDVDDIADVAVAAMTEEKHAGELYELTGPRLLSFANAASEISQAANVPVQYIPLTLEQFHDGLAADAGPEMAHMMTELCREVLDGRNAHLADGVQKALGRAPRDFADYCRATAQSGVWQQ